MVKPMLKYNNLSFSQDGGRPPFWICGLNFGTTDNENLVFLKLIIRATARYVI